ncbi:hypothetical protein Tco_0261898 [Tanacetum coccineum]
MKKFMLLKSDTNNAKDPHLHKDSSTKEEGKTLEEAYYTQFGGTFQEGGYKATAPGTRGLEAYQPLTETNPRDQVKSISTTIETDSNSICRIGSTQYAVSTRQNRTVLYKSRQTTVPFLSRLDNHYCEEEVGNYEPNFAKPMELHHNNDTIPQKEKDLGDDLMPTHEEGEVIEEFRTRDEDLDTGIDDYPSYCDHDKKIHVNMISKKFHNSIMKDKMVYKGNNVIGPLMNIPIFVGTFSFMTNFAVLENMEDYRDEGMGDVIFDEPFLREVGIKTKRFEGMITIFNGDDEVTYQMVRSYPRFKNHTIKQCNKIPPLLMVSE